MAASAAQSEKGGHDGTRNAPEPQHPRVVMIVRDLASVVLDAVIPTRRRASVVGHRAHVEIRCVPREDFPAYRDGIVRRLRRLRACAGWR